jgi:hypothetical protein
VQFATHGQEKGQAVAIAKSSEGKTETSWRWYLEFPDRNPMTVSFSPEATREEVSQAYPGAAVIVPFAPTPETPDASLSASDEANIRAWLSDIGEGDQSIRDVVVDECRKDASARAYYLGRAGEDAEAIIWNEDDRRRCAHCLNPQVNGACKVAQPGGVVSAARGYRPSQEWLHRCAGYRPCPDDPDRRTGPERWPEFQEANT